MIYRASVADFQSIYSLVCDLEKTTFIFEAFKRHYVKPGPCDSCV